MARTRLNLDALRRNGRFRSSSLSSSHPDEAFDPNGSVPISRRRMIGLAGMTVLGASPALKSARAALSGQFEVRGDEHRLAFILGGKERWVIEPARFGGGGRLSVEKTARRILLSLENAFYPGTDLPADFRCEISPGLSGSRFSFELSFGGFKGKGTFEKWLLGLEPLRSGVKVNGSFFPLGDSAALKLLGKADALFYPDWSLKLEGKEVLSLEGLSNLPLRSDLFSIALPEPGLPLLMNDPDPLRSVVTIRRGDRDWALRPEVEKGKGWSVFFGTNAFDRITIEGGEAGRSNGEGLLRGRRSAALLADSAGGNDGKNRKEGIAFLPEGGFLSPDGSPFRLPLAEPRYALEFLPKKNRTVLIADYPEKPVAMRADGMSLKLGRGGRDDRFELTGEGGRAESMRCEPAIAAVTLPLKGAVVQAVKPQQETRLRFFPEPKEKNEPGRGPAGAIPPDVPDPAPDREEGEVTLDESKSGVVTFPLSSVIWVLRPADMLYLGFEFINMKVTSGAGTKPKKSKTYGGEQIAAAQAKGAGAISIIAAEKPLSEQVRGVGKVKTSITSTGGSSKSYLVVHFPPQNIAEQAFWEAEDPADHIGEEKPTNMKSNPGGSEKEDLPPVQHRIAGPSRLAFKLPEGSNSIPYLLEDLLNWSVLEPSLVPVALPPPPPPSPAVGSILDLSTSLQGKIAAGYTDIKRNVGKFATRGMSRNPGKGLGVGERSAGEGTISKGIYKETYAVNAKTDISGLTQGIAQGNDLIAENASLRSDPEQLAVLITDSPAAKFDFYLNLKALTPEIVKPQAHQTSIEAPYRLMLSPHVYAGWAHAGLPVTHDGVTELWHTRLGVRKDSGAVDENDSYYRTLRAVWSPDFAPDPDVGPASDNWPFRTTLNSRDRHEIVHLSSNFAYKKDAKYIPESVEVERFMMSAMGAWMNTRGAWEPPPGLSIEEWRHRGTMGRDHYVRVVYKGFLFPFGNRASLVKVTERKIRNFSRGGYIAYMYQRMYIVVRKPEMIWPALNQPYGGRRTPFRSVRLTTLVTPNLDQPDVGESKIKSYGDEAFWPRVEGEDFLFNVVATDWEGNQTEFSTPLAFVNNKWAFDYTAVTDVMNSYSSARSKRQLYGKAIAYAPSKKPGDTAFETDFVVFTADLPTSDMWSVADPASLPKLPAKDDPNMYAADQPYFYPAFKTSKVRIDAVEQINGTAAFQEIELHDAYYKHGIESSNNKGQVFAKLLTQVELSFNTNADKGGGIATPNVNIAGLSRSLGTVGGKIEEITQAKFDPSSFFDKALDANLLGGISLRDIIEAVNDFAGDILKIPQMLNSKNFTNPKELVGNIQDLMSAVDAVKNDVEKFKEMKTALDSTLSQIQALPDTLETASESVKKKGEELRQQALALVKQIENEAKGIVDQAKNYADTLVNKMKSIVESDSLVGLLESLGLPTELTLELKWAPTVKSWPNAGNPNSLMGSNALFYVTPGKENDVFVLLARLTVKLDGSAPEFLLEGKAQNFKIRLIPIDDAAPEGFVHLQFEKLRFYSENAKKPEVDIVFNVDTGITFHGPLHFVEVIREYIPFDGFSDPPSLDVSPSGITAGFTFPIPSIAVGVFSLQNISLGATLELPFTNSPIVFTFLFCTRENPFVLTVSMLGGGGFFGLIISTKEIGFEAALEFGGNFAFNIGVASGGVYVMAGVYYKKMGEEVILEGYVKLGGSLEILGLITVSVEFYMSLTYQEPGGKVTGQATLTVKIEILFFSTSVSLHVERRFKGSKNDPLFIDLMSQDHWTEYCNAYA